MGLLRQSHVTWLCGVFVTTLNTLFFVVYFSLLGLPLTIMSMVFVVVGSVSYFLLTHIARYYWWQAICHVLLAFVYLWSLVNFVYFQVFGVFLDFSLAPATQAGVSSFGFFVDFVYMIPLNMWLLAGIMYAAIVVNMVWYNKLQRREFHSVTFGGAFMTVSQERGKRRLTAVALWAVALLAINGVAISATAQLINNPQEGWWDVREQTADLGLWGKLYAASATKKTPEPVERPATSKTLLEQTKQAYASLSTYDPGERRIISLPRFEAKPNVLVVQLESFPGWVLQQDPTPVPFLKSLMEQGLTVDQFHGTSCQTINAEFTGMCSLWPDVANAISVKHTDKTFHCLPSVLANDYGYDTYYYHANVPSFWRRDVFGPAWGFQHMIFTPQFEERENDHVVFTRAVDELSKSTKPFLGYIVSYTTHAPHIPATIEHESYKNHVEVEPYTAPLNAQFQNLNLNQTETQVYLSLLQNTDDSLRTMFQQLDETGLRNNTVVVLYSDHRYYGFKGDDMAAFHGYNDLPMVIVPPGNESGKLQAVSSHLDIAPTILHLIEGDAYLPREQFMGTSLFSSAFPNTVINKCLNQVYAVTPHAVIEGNATTGQYRFQQPIETMPADQQAAMLSAVKDTVGLSDEALFANQLLK